MLFNITKGLIASDHRNITRGPGGKALGGLELDYNSRAPLGVLFLTALLSMLFILWGCSGSHEEPLSGETNPSGSGEFAIPLVTLKHWKDSNPGERYSFLIGFLTMMELEKEWQGKDSRPVLPFDQSLIGAWARSVENRPLTEIYHDLNRYAANNPGDLGRPVAEVMWFLFAQPRMSAQNPTGVDESSSAQSEPLGSN